MRLTQLLTPAALAILLAAPDAWSAATRINSCGKTLTQPGLYELQDNLDAAGSCIIVQSDFVTINLNGFRIRGNGTGYAVVETGIYRGTSVRNGTVSNFENAIQIGVGATVDEVKSFDNANVGILVQQGIVRNSHAQGNLNNHGIAVGPRSLVTGNISLGNRTGIGATHGSRIDGNTVSDNSVGGILTIGSGMIVSNNAVFNNGSFGIAVDCPSLALGNTTLFHSTENLRLNGAGCKDEHNVAQ